MFALDSGTCRGSVVGLALLVAACGPSHHLGEYDFHDSLLASVVDVPPYPEISTGPLVVDAPKDERNPIETVQAVLRAGSRVAREVAVRGAQDKLERAAEKVDMPAVIEDEALRRSTRILRADAGSERSADFVLQIVVRRYGIEAKDWDASAYYFINAEATLIDRSSERRIWKAKVKASAPMGPEVFGHAVVRDVVTAAAVADLSEEDMALALQQLSEFSATEITNKLREDLLDAHR